MSRGDIVVVEADLECPGHQRAIVELTAAYARDAMGNDGSLPDAVLDALIPGLRAHPTTLVLLASIDADIVGIATCFRGFSTFVALPILNLHDVFVLERHRGRGIGRALVLAAEAAAVKRGCAKMTLEVQEHNRRARRLYESVGFSQAVYNPANGGALFYAKALGSGPGPPGAPHARRPCGGAVRVIHSSWRSFAMPTGSR